MAVANKNFADLTANGTSEWVQLHRPGLVVSVDCVDADGESAAWGDTNATLLYSPDAKMACTVKNESGQAITGTDGFTELMVVTGYVAVSATGIDGERLRVKVQQTGAIEGSSAGIVR